MSNKEVVTKEEAGVPAELGFMAGAEQTGFEGADFNSFATPFLRILQPNSPQLIEESDNYIDGAKPGMFFNTVTNKLYDKSVRVIPVFFKRNFVEWKPDQGGFVAAHSPEDAARIGEKVPGEMDMYTEAGNILAENFNFYLLIESDMEAGPIILAQASSGIRHAKKWMSNMRMLKMGNKPAPMFSSVYTLATSLNENNQGKWYQIGTKEKTNIKREGWITAEQYTAVEAALEILDSLKVDYSHLDDNKMKNVNEDNNPY